ncbi:MAG: metal-dependent hydrolase [Proteobacteria bacterium]|nr:metal-dependent hydrolase [Pseudomonadota bacterium]HQR02762.1 metal-dependent hydrolase [Rhodocyclaceae bacterium]
MHARKPDLDFSRSLPHWARSREFSHMFNGISIVIMELEPFLNRVMRKAREALPESDSFRMDMSTFVRQEANHTMLHGSYNQALYGAGYAALTAVGESLRQDYARYLHDWPLRDQLAYCEGFESLGPIWAEFLFEGADDLLAGADPAVVNLWKWHLAEEFEHRMVAYTAYHRFGGRWLHRLRFTMSTHRHLEKHIRMAEAIMLNEDWKHMSPAEVEASRQKSERMHQRLNRFISRRLWRLALPGYSPERIRMPNGIDHYLRLT